MLEALRKSTAGWVAKIFIGLLVLSFAVWGIADIFGGYGTQTVATVGDKEISSVEYQNEFQREVRALGNRLRRNVTVDDARSLGLDSQVLLRLIGDAAIDNQANSLGLGISDKAVIARIQREPAFKDASGKFSRERFFRILQANNLSQEAFLLRQKRGLILEQITGTVTQNGIVPDTLLEAVNQYRNETRKLDYIEVPLEQAGTVAEPTDAQLREYYNTHKSEFRAPQFRKAGLVPLTPDELMKKVEISDDDIATYYEANKDKFGTPERRAVMQITFANLEEAQKAFEKLKGGADFMEVAKARGLTKKDVDLGLIPKSSLADEAVADAVFALPVNEISEPIQGALATVIAKVTKIEPAVEKTLADERENIRKLLAAEQAATKILDTYDKIEDERAAGTTLQEVAQKLDLPYVSIEAVDARGRDADGETVEIFAKNPVLLSALFESDVGLENDPEETGDRGFIWYEVLKITKERLKSFEEVKDEVAKKWRATEERRLLAKKGQEYVDTLRGGKSLAALSEEVNLKIKSSDSLKRSSQSEDLPQAVIQQAFALKEGDFGSSPSADGKKRIVFQVREATKPTKVEGKTKEALVKSLSPDIGDDLIVQYVRALRDEYGVNINQTVFQDATAGRGR